MSVLLIAFVLVACSVVNSGGSITYTVSLSGTWSMTISQYEMGTAVICPGKQVELGWQIAGINSPSVRLNRFDPPRWDCATTTTNQTQGLCRIIRETRLDILGGSLPACTGGPKINAMSKGCISVIPEQPGLYELEVEDSRNTYVYNARLEIVKENYVYHLNAHYDTGTVTWMANVQFADPDILVSSAQWRFTDSGSMTIVGGGPVAWEVTNDHAPGTTLHIPSMGVATAPGYFSLLGKYSLKPIDSQTGQILSSTNLDKSAVISLDLSTYCK